MYGTEILSIVELVDPVRFVCSNSCELCIAVLASTQIALLASGILNVKKLQMLAGYL